MLDGELLGQIAHILVLLLLSSNFLLKLGLLFISRYIYILDGGELTT